MVFDGRILFLAVQVIRFRRDLRRPPASTRIRDGSLLHRARNIVAAKNTFFRQRDFLVLSLVWLGILWITPDSLSAAGGYHLKPSQTPAKFQRVKVALEVHGKLKLNAAGSTITKLPIKVKGEIERRTNKSFGA